MASRPPPEDVTWPGHSQPVIATSGEWGEAFSDSDSEPTRYQRGAVLGRGGMGTVYLAEDPRLRRQVAIKEALGHPEGPAAIRLRREARITAALDHPSIVPVFDTGVDDDGRPWYAMRVVRGETLAEHLSRRPLLVERMRLLRPFFRACEAVAHAHHRGIIHRDLKPDNILLGPFGETQVMDWGLARPVGDATGDWDAVLSGVKATMVGSVLGTPAYMSPEQAAGDRVDRRADVWSLGVCLFEILTGHPPFSGESARDILAGVMSGTLPDPTERTPEAPPELCAIICRATASHPGDRYPDAAALAEDLEAWLDGRRVSAHRYTAAEEISRTFSRFRRTVLVAGAIGAVALAAVLLAWRGTLQQRDAALAAQEALLAEQVRSDRHLAQALVSQARAAARAGARGEAEILAAHALTLAELPEARGLLMDSGARPILTSSLTMPDCLEARLSPDGSTVACRTAESLSLLESDTLAVRWRVDIALSTLGFTGAGHPQGMSAEGVIVRLFDAATGGMLPTPLTIYGGIYSNITGSHPHRLGQGNNAGALFYDLQTGERRNFSRETELQTAWADASGELMRLDGGDLIWTDWDGTERSRHTITPGWARDNVRTRASMVQGEMLMLGKMDGHVELRSRDGSVLHSRVRIGPGNIDAVALSRSGKWALAIDESGATWLWPTTAPAARMRFPNNTRSARFIGDQTLLILGRELQQWSLPDNPSESQLDATSGVSNLDWQGALLGVSLGNGSVRVWKDGERRRDMLISTDNVAKDIAIGPDRDRFAGAALERPIRTSGLEASEEVVDWDLPGFRRLVWLAGDLLVGAPPVHGPGVYRLGSGPYPGLRQIGAELLDLEPSADRTQAIMVARSGDVMRVTAGEPPTIETLFTVTATSAVALSGERVATVYTDRVVLRSLSGEEVWSAPTDTWVRDVAFSHDGALLAAGERNGLVRIWRVRDGALLAVLDGHTERAQAVVFSPAGDQLATGSWDETVRLWDLSVLDDEPAALLSTIEAAWGMTLEEALGSRIGR